jgi:PAS domain S-box-containing protein
MDHGGEIALPDRLATAEAEVSALKASLEQRTAELSTAAETLRCETEERRRAEAVLRRGEERYRSLVEAVTAIVWNTPASGEFESQQSGWSAFTGQDYDRLKGWGWLDAVHPDDRQNTARVWSAAVASRSLYQVEHRLRRHDGVYRHMMVRAVPILDETGAIREWVGIHTDIDDLKQAEAAQREAKEAAQAANRAKSDFLANMSHEIRTPMNGVIGMTELALGTELTAEQREYLDMVKSSADYLLAVINDILDFSKIEAGKLDLDPVDFNLRDHLDETITTLSLRAHGKGLELACHVLDDVPEVLVGDACRLRQILVNLIGNAIKFTSAGEVAVRVERESQDETSAGLHFSVRDTGIGIPREKLSLLFQAFSQVDASTTRKYGGTGLGLAISLQLVKLMGGRVWVESEPGQGSTFHFTVRLGLSTSAAAPAAPADLARLRGLPVLVVDDNATNRRILQDMLRRWQAAPALVESGREALAAMHSAARSGEPFQLVLLDNMMPGMDGFTLAEEIARQPGLAGSTLMMLSSADRRENIARCRDSGVKAYLTKPIRRAELQAAILSALGGVPGQEMHASSGARRSIATGACCRRVLLTEDNAVNQKLAVRLLEKRGHSVVVAGFAHKGSIAGDFVGNWMFCP